ncbi:MAG: hypothetical protein AABZ65_00375 [Candidatus Omnitrophota bacterium]
MNDSNKESKNISEGQTCGLPSPAANVRAAKSGRQACGVKLAAQPLPRGGSDTTAEGLYKDFWLTNVCDSPAGENRIG